MRIKMNAVAAATAMVLGAFSTTASADLVITEYSEGDKSFNGGGNNKAIEISNLGTVAVDLTKVKIASYTKGAANTIDAPNYTYDKFTGELAPNSSLVIYNSGATDGFKTRKSAIDVETTGITWFTGNDTLILSQDGAIVDIFGKFGEDPGSAGWTDGSNPDFTTSNTLLRRKANVTTGVTDITADFPGSTNQWVLVGSKVKGQITDIEASKGFGCPGEDACSSDATPGGLLITEYSEGDKSFNGGGNNKAIEISNLGTVAVDLTKVKIASYTKGAANTIDAPNYTYDKFTGELAPNSSLVIYNSGATDGFKTRKSAIDVETTGVTYFTGNDTLILSQDGVIVDIFGKFGEDPGSNGWADANNPDFTTSNAILRRKANVTTGVTDITADFPGSTNQWVLVGSKVKGQITDIEASKGFGCPGEDACSGDVTPPEPEPETGPCTGCETLTPVADPATFNAEIYYSDVLSGDFANAEELKNALSVIIAKDHKQLSYKQVWSTLTYADQDPADDKKVIEIYTGESISKYDNQTSGSGAGKWNREHVWAKSHGFPSDSQWGYTDAHHLRPSDPGINTARSNNDFGACSDTGEEVQFNGVGTGNYLNKTTDCWEPRDEVKGDVARMIMYMDTRYQGTDTATTNMPDLIVVDRLTTTAEDSEPLIGTLCTLYAWNTQDPVDSYEQNRNNQVYKYQGNRNPFIDRPELVQEVYGAVCGDDPNPALVVDGDIVTPESVTEGTAYTIDASAITAGEGVTLTYKWEQIVAEEKTVVGDQAVLSLTAPEVKADETLNFTLTISDGSLATTKDVSLSVVNVPLTLSVEFAGATKVTEGDKTTITATVADAPEGTGYSWKQLSGTTAEFTATGLTLDVTSPSVNIDQVLVFELTATVGEESFSKSVSIEVENTEEAGWTKPDGAGSLGGLMTLLLPLMWWRRRQG